MKLFIYTGSFAEYRLGVKRIDTAYLYSATKTAFRAFLEYFTQLNDYKYITAIPYTVYGGKPTVKRIMDYMMDAKDSKIPVDMTGGLQILDFIHVDDISSFFFHTIKNIETYMKLSNGEEFHLGTGIGTTLRQVASIIERECGCKLNINWGGHPYRDRDTMYAVAPIMRNVELTGWRAEINIHEGIKNS